LALAILHSANQEWAYSSG